MIKVPDVLIRKYITIIKSIKQIFAFVGHQKISITFCSLKFAFRTDNSRSLLQPLIWIMCILAFFLFLVLDSSQTSIFEGLLVHTGIEYSVSNGSTSRFFYSTFTLLEVRQEGG
jgi:hypothetical protein